jgi:hypothetical protein
MARKKKQITATEQTESPSIEIAATEDGLNAEAVEPAPVSPLRKQVRPMPATEWDTLVTEMHDYTTTRRNMVEVSLTKSHETADKFVAHKKPVRNAGQTETRIALRDEVPPTPVEPPVDHVNLDKFYRNGRIKRTRT